MQKRSGARRASGSEEQHTAPRELHAALKAPQDANVICIVTVAGALPPRTTTVLTAPMRAASGSQSIQPAKDRLLVRNRVIAKTGDAERLDGAHEIAEVPNQERHENGVELAGAECSVVKQRRKRVADRIANDTVNASLPRDSLRLPVNTASIVPSARAGRGAVTLVPTEA